MGGTTSFVCGEGGRRALRKTTDHLTGKTQRVIDFAGLAEIRPDDGPDGILLLRLPAGGTTVVEEARSLVNGARVYEESGYVHSDVRGSILAKTAYEGPALLMTHAAEYDAWGNTVNFTGLDAPRHKFVGFEPDPTTGNYFFGARVYDPTLKRWLSPDPLLWIAPELDKLEGTQLNLYGYSANNPVKFVDPGGLQVMSDMAELGGCAGPRCGVSPGAAKTSVGVGDPDPGLIGNAVSKMIHFLIQAGPLGTADDLGHVYNDMRGGHYKMAAAGVGIALLPVQRKFLDVLGQRAKQVADASGNPAGTYRPDRQLSRDVHGNFMPDPDAVGPHTQLGKKSGRRGEYTQAREFDAHGNPVRDIDFTDHGRPNQHSKPHQHRYLENSTGGTKMRSTNAQHLDD